MAKKYKPFATTSQLINWMEKNCNTCRKRFVNIRAEFRCDWERKLCGASIYNDPIAEETAKAIGFLDSKGCDLWQCPGWARR